MFKNGSDIPAFLLQDSQPVQDFRRMQFVKCSVPVVVLLMSASIGLAQQTPLSAGFVLGGSNYLGEIGGKYEPRASLLDADIITTSPTVGGFCDTLQTIAYASLVRSTTFTFAKQTKTLKIRRVRPAI